MIKSKNDIKLCTVKKKKKANRGFWESPLIPTVQKQLKVTYGVPQGSTLGLLLIYSYMILIGQSMER